jgi:hypothetical protein
MVASSDKKKQKPKKLNQESIEIVAKARSTVPKAAKTTKNPPKDSRCYLDSGATCPIFSPDKLTSPALCMRAIRAPSYLRILLKQAPICPVTSFWNSPKEDDSPTVILRNTGCLYVEDLGYNLISVGKLANKGIASIFRAHTVELKTEPKPLIIGKRNS